MDYPRIVKSPLASFSVKPNLYDYEKMRETFRWEDIAKELDWFDSDYINIAHVAIDSHLKTPRREKKALIWQGQRGEIEEYTFADLARLSNKFANLLTNEIHINKGDRVFFFLDRIPEIFIGILGTLKAGAVIGPLFSAFGPDAVKDRLSDSRARVLVTSPTLKAKVKEVFADLPHLEKIIIVNREQKNLDPGDFSYESAMEKASDKFETVRTGREDYAIMHYTSGTTGKPKGAVHVHNAVIGHYATAKYVLDLHPDDIYWCTADPGWVTGTSYGMFGPWSNGVTQVVYSGMFSARAWYKVLESWKVNVWYTAPPPSGCS